MLSMFLSDRKFRSSVLSGSQRDHEPSLRRHGAGSAWSLSCSESLDAALCLLGPLLTVNAMYDKARTSFLNLYW